MKKLVCILIALTCVCGFAFAQAEAPSKTVADMMGSLVSAENVADAAAAGLFVEPLNEFSSRFDLEEYQYLLDIAQSEIEKLLVSANVTDYFGEVTVASTMKKVPLIDLFDNTQPSIYEFMPIIAGGYHVSYGNVKATLLFATPYEPGQHVAVLIGIVDEKEEEDDYEVDWYAYDGLCVRVPEVDGGEGIEVVFAPEMMETLQNQDTLVAIASEPFDFE